MSKLDDIFNDTLVHTLELRLDEDIPAMKKQVKDLIIEMTDENYTDAFNKCERDEESMEQYAEWVAFREKVKAL